MTEKCTRQDCLLMILVQDNTYPRVISLMPQTKI